MKEHTAILERIKQAFTHNLVLKIIAAVFAVLLWAYALVALNPIRTKYIEGVTISLEGDTDLLSRNLILVNSDLGLADVNVSAEITNHAALDNTRIDCVGSLSRITRAGTYTLPLSVTVQSNLGSVIDASPDRVTVEVDKLTTKAVPVSLVLDGALPEGYEVLSKSVSASVTLSGASRYIVPAVRAEAHVSLEERTSSVEEAVNLVFFDKESNEIEVITRSGETPSATVSVEVSAVKEVTIEPRVEVVSDAYYDVSTVLSRETVKLSGDKSVLDGIESVKTAPIVPAEELGTQELETELLLPGGTALVSGQSAKVSATVTITEKVDVLENFPVPITYVGLGKNLIFASDKPAVALVNVAGTVRQLELLSADNVTLQVDLTGLSEGEYEVSPVLVFQRSDEVAGLTFSLTEPTFHLVIQKKTEG